MEPAGASGTMGEKAGRIQGRGINVPPHLSFTHGSWAPRQSVSSQIPWFNPFFLFLFLTSIYFKDAFIEASHLRGSCAARLRKFTSVSTMDFGSLFQKLQHKCLISRNTKACVPGQPKPVPALTLGLVKFFSSVPLLASVCHDEWAVG